jgi:hypothetical protein
MISTVGFFQSWIIHQFHRVDIDCDIFRHPIEENECDAFLVSGDLCHQKEVDYVYSSDYYSILDPIETNHCLVDTCCIIIYLPLKV